MVAALFVEAKGVYSGLPDVDCWPEDRDARLYAGPHPCVAHPPCQRWSMLANVVQSRYPHLRVGADGGCFASALASVRKWGGVLEHPAESMAWPAHGLPRPSRAGWQFDSETGGWVCEVAQSAYGHRARKRTWLFYFGACPPPPLRWEKPRGEVWVSWLAKDTPMRPKSMPKDERRKTPVAFRDALLDIARTARPREGGT
jgi:hypothetical protein